MTAKDTKVDSPDPTDSEGVTIKSTRSNPVSIFMGWATPSNNPIPTGQLLKRQKLWTIFSLIIFMIVGMFTLVLSGMAHSTDCSFNENLENWAKSMEKVEVDPASLKALRSTKDLLERDTTLQTMIFVLLCLSLLSTLLHFVLFVFEWMPRYTKSFKVHMLYFFLGVLLVACSFNFLYETHSYKSRVYLQGSKGLDSTLDLDLALDMDEGSLEQIFNGYSIKLQMQRSLLSCVPQSHHSKDKPLGDDEDYGYQDAYRSAELYDIRYRQYDDETILTLPGICMDYGDKIGAAVMSMLVGMALFAITPIYYCTGPTPKGLMASKRRIIPIHMNEKSVYYSPAYPKAYPHTVAVQPQAKDKPQSLVPTHGKTMESETSL